MARSRQSKRWHFQIQPTAPSSTLWWGKGARTMDDKRKAFDEWCRTTSFYSTETMGGRYVSTHAGAAWEAWQAATAAREREVEELREELAAAKSFPFAAYMEIADLRARWY